MPDSTAAHQLSDEWDEQVDGWVLGQVRVTRHVPFYTAIGGWRKRSVEEFVVALQAATEGLDECEVEGHDYYESVRVVVVGLRDPSPEETAEREQREYLHWIAAKTTYAQGLARGFESRPRIVNCDGRVHTDGSLRPIGDCDHDNR